MREESLHLSTPLSIRTVGLEKVLQNLSKEIKNIKGRTRKGMIKAGLLILRGAQNRVPVRFANLKASGFLVWASSQNNKAPSWNDGSQESITINLAKKTATSTRSAPKVDVGQLARQHEEAIEGLRQEVRDKSEQLGVGIGFSAFYALYVHENEEMQHPNGGEAKFLEREVDAQRDRILSVIAKEAKI